MTGDCQARICGGPGLRCPGLPDLSGVAPRQEHQPAEHPDYER